MGNVLVMKNRTLPKWVLLEKRECKDEKRRSEEVRTCAGGENVIRKTGVGMRRRLGNIVGPLTKVGFLIIMLQ